MGPSVWSISCVATLLLATQGSVHSQSPSDFIRDPCASFQCNNGGTCTAPADAPYCLCPPGYSGERCDDRIITRNPCTFFQCNNGGTCTAPADRPYCLCPPGYTGDRCDDRIFSRDPCTFFQCNNGGTCTAPADAPYCLCPPGYTGDRCDDRIFTRDPCTFFQCNNGGTCTAPADAPYCLCPPGFEGKTCEMKSAPVIIQPPPLLTCATVLCITGTICRMVLPCETCTELKPRCIRPELLGPEPNADCLRQKYLEALFVEDPVSTVPPTYSLFKCKGPEATGSCPQGYVCVYDQKEGGTCCTGKPDPNAEKPGTCPQGDVSVCGGVPCDNDYDCSGDQKCCSGCGKFCTDPVKEEEMCGNTVCAQGETCVQKQPACRPGFVCIQALIPTCVPDECAACKYNEDCREISRDTSGLQRPVYQCISRNPCGPEPCQPGQECRYVTTVCSSAAEDGQIRDGDIAPVSPACKDVYECQAVDECGGCPKGEVCKDTGIRCFTTPCPTYQCVPDDPCGGCAKGEVCKDTGIVCITTPCPTFQCVPDDPCGGCAKGEVCKDTGIRCITTPCPTFQCVRDDPCGGCAEGEVCKDTGIVCITAPCPTFQCVPDDPCGGCAEGEVCKDTGIRCVTAPCPTFQCVQDDPCGGCAAGEVCKDTGIVCKKAPCPTFQCVPDDPCGGCASGEVCIDTGIRCFTTPCPTYQCVPENECGGCPKGQKCELLYPPCAPPPDCDEIRRNDPDAECIVPKCDPIPTCVDDDSGTLEEKPTDVSEIPDPVRTPQSFCPLRCPSNSQCQPKKPDCSGGVCLLMLQFECVPLKREARSCPAVSMTYNRSSFMCMLEQQFQKECKNEDDCSNPDEKCCPSKCGRRVCLDLRKGGVSMMG